MPRGITPRQPARTGRHEGIRKAAPRKKPGALRTPRTGKSARPHTVVCRTSCHRGSASKKAYNPTAPDRVQEILQRLEHSLSRRHLRPAPQERMGTAGGDHSLRPVHGRSA